MSKPGGGRKAKVSPGPSPIQQAFSMPDLFGPARASFTPAPVQRQQTATAAVSGPPTGPTPRSSPGSPTTSGMPGPSGSGPSSPSPSPPPPSSSTIRSSNAWSKKPTLTPSKPKPKVDRWVERRSGLQTREFYAGGSRSRSLSVSRRHEKRTVTAVVGGKTATYGPWIHTGDTRRQHTHPGGTAHTPTATPGFTGGSKSTPSERQKLDAAPSTVAPSQVDWNK